MLERGGGQREWRTGWDIVRAFAKRTFRRRHTRRRCRARAPGPCPGTRVRPGTRCTSPGPSSPGRIRCHRRRTKCCRRAGGNVRKEPIWDCVRVKRTFRRRHARRQGKDREPGPCPGTRGRPGTRCTTLPTRRSAEGGVGAAVSNDVRSRVCAQRASMYLIEAVRTSDAAVRRAVEERAGGARRARAHAKRRLLARRAGRGRRGRARRAERTVDAGRAVGRRVLAGAASDARRLPAGRLQGRRETEEEAKSRSSRAKGAEERESEEGAAGNVSKNARGGRRGAGRKYTCSVPARQRCCASSSGQKLLGGQVLHPPASRNWPGAHVGAARTGPRRARRARKNAAASEMDRMAGGATRRGRRARGEGEGEGGSMKGKPSQGRVVGVEVARRSGQRALGPFFGSRLLS